MKGPAPQTDRAQLVRNRARARPDALFLHEEAAAEIEDRLQMVKKSFTRPAIITGFPDFWRRRFPNATIVGDEEVLDLTPGAHDLVISALVLHWASDPLIHLFQALKALEPDGFFLGATFAGATLADLRQALRIAESEVAGGLSPRVAPMADIRDLGDAMQQAGFALPVLDTTTRQVSYPDFFALLRDLRAMGEGNALADRLRRPTRRQVFERAGEIYAGMSPGDGGRILARFEMIFLAGWSPHESQPRPLRPGSAQIRLADALARMKKTPAPTAASPAPHERNEP